MRPKLKVADPGDGSERYYIGAKSVRWEEFQAEQTRRLDRDAFASAALTGLLNDGGCYWDNESREVYVAEAYLLSDEMMKRREKEG